MAEKVVPTRDSFGRLQDGTEISRWEKCSNPSDQVGESGGGGYKLFWHSVQQFNWIAKFHITKVGNTG